MYSDDEKCAQDTQPGWGGSGESCSRCGTIEYFNGDMDGEPMCNDCLSSLYSEENEY